jgi:histone deacetylase 1/2
MENLPIGRNTIGNKWVFPAKAKPDGSIDRFKARLVAQGFSQRAGVDYEGTFSPVVKLSTLRTVIAAKGDMHMHSADIETTFLNADLQEEIYMRQPKGQRMGHLVSCAGLKASTV